MYVDLLFFAVYFVLILAGGALAGSYMYRIFKEDPVREDAFFGPVERGLYRVCGLSENVKSDMNWKQYALALMVFNLFGMALLYLIQVSQGFLPWNPEHFGAPDWHLALNTAVSITTNTDWQAYGGESTLSYFSQMAGIAVQNFLSAATGIAVAAALIRAMARRETREIGNFWRDLVRIVVRLLLPVSFVFALVLVSQGVPQNFSDYITVTGLDGAEQTIAQGPVASQEAIKEFGTNGGGFFNVNSAHPYENPTPFTNLLEMVMSLIISIGIPFAFGHFVGSKKQGYVLLAAMGILFVVMLAICYAAETSGNPNLAALGVSQPTSYEGKEVRFGMDGSVLFTVMTTATTCGAVNNMHDSLTALGGMVPMMQILIGEVIFGGVGAGFYGMMSYVLMTIFIIGLMVGRTPEYLGKKIGENEIRLAMIALLIPACGILINAAISSVTEAGLAGLNNNGPHGLSEIIYAYASAFDNNGSAFAGLTVNTLFYDLLLGLSIFIGRFAVIIPILALAGCLARQKIVPETAGTFDTGSPMFVGLLMAVALITGALTFFPALSLGPVVEHFLMMEGVLF